MIVYASRTLQVPRETSDAEVKPLRAEVADIDAAQAADEAGYRQRTAERGARREALTSALVAGVIVEAVEAAVALDEATGEVVDLHPDTGAEIARTRLDDATLLRWAADDRTAPEVKAAAEKLCADRGLTPKEEG